MELEANMPSKIKKINYLTIQHLAVFLYMKNTLLKQDIAVNTNGVQNLMY